MEPKGTQNLSRCSTAHTVLNISGLALDSIGLHSEALG
jgi:hypothetical protein